MRLNLVMFIIGVLISYLFYLFPKEMPVPFWIFCLPIITSIFLIGLLWVHKREHQNELQRAKEKNKQITFKIIDIRNTSTQEQEFLFTSSHPHLFYIGSWFSVFEKKGSFENHYGVARVQNITTDGLIQARGLLLSSQDLINEYDLLAIKLGINEIHLPILQ